MFVPDVFKSMVLFYYSVYRSTYGMASHHDYMTLKKQKLDDQNSHQEYMINSKQVSSILQGVSIYITGFTNPSSAVLKELVLRNGGKVQMFFSKTYVTHIIASNLPDFKVKLWKNDLVVMPQWVVDCDAAQILLPAAKYILYRTSENIRDIISKSTSAKDDTIKQTTKLPIPETTSSNFVDEFYSNSRLHHLSTSATELRHTVNKLQSQYHPAYVPTNRSQTHSLILHIDIDCFFVSISLKSRPHLKGLPVAVTHAKPNDKSDNSYAEISSCSYEARKFGVKNGMFLGKALSFCPNIVTVPYEFDEYHSASNELYRIMVHKTPYVEVVSCDEAFIDVVEILDASNEDEIAGYVQELRAEIHAAIGCTVSVGVGPNKLISRMATRAGKPNGQFICCGGDAIKKYLQSQDVSDLPGIGRSTAHKLSSEGYEKCNDLLALSRSKLSELLGGKTGETVFNFCRGIDTRELTVKHERKSISVEINYGIRVQTVKELELFLLNLSKELEKRMGRENVTGSLVTIKLKQRSEDASLEPVKYMGHGICDNISKSLNIATSTMDGGVIHSKVMSLITSMALVPSDIRGVGIQMGKLKDNSETQSNFKQPKHSSKIVERGVCKAFQFPEPEFVGSKDDIEIKQVLRTWCKSNEPYQVDVDQVDRYFTELMDYGNINLLQEILRHIRKILELKNNCEWNAVFNGSLQRVQQKIHLDFNGILDIESL